MTTPAQAQQRRVEYLADEIVRICVMINPQQTAVEAYLGHINTLHGQRFPTLKVALGNMTSHEIDEAVDIVKSLGWYCERGVSPRLVPARVAIRFGNAATPVGQESPK